VKNLTVLIPFFNEEKFIEESLRKVLQTNFADEIILIDDGSTDYSLKIVNEITNSLDFVKVLKSNKNLGKGNALNIARKHIKTSHVVIHDADLEYNPEDILKMIEQSKLSPNSLILGTRFEGSETRVNIYKRTYYANKLMSLIFSFIHNFKISDIATCYKLMPSKFFKNLDINENGFSIEVETLAKFLKYNKSIVEVPISYQGRSYKEGKKIKATDGFSYIIKTFKYKFLD
jgi:glycosyltransferase involved in cell wall biosynthesis